MNKKKITVSVPSYLRAKGTIRAINCVANQNINNWEAFFIGDGCPVMKDFVESNYFADLILDCKNRGNDLIIKNNEIHLGGHGFEITNQNIKNATGEYFCFFANDDIILPNHFENYLSEIDGSDYDFMFFDSFVTPRNAPRFSSMQYGCIGHSELIVKTEFLKTMPLHNKEYGHDWQLIYTMAEKGKWKKAESKLQTYNVMSLSDNREQGIE